MNWQIGQIVRLKKKKKNGFPKGREIGGLLEIVNIITDSNKIFEKNVVLEVCACENPRGSFKLHESYLMNIIEYRDKIIEEILTNE